jgi:hypothetical protein
LLVGTALSKVYAVEPSDVIAVAREIACANGLGDRIEFIQAMSADVTLPERADVIVSDLHGVLPFFKQHLTSIISEPCCWGTIDYTTVQSPDVSSTVTGRAQRDGVAHGLIVSFDAMLREGVGFSNAPGEPAMIYGVGFLPFSSTVDVETGDSITVSLRAKLVGADYVSDTTSHRDRAGGTGCAPVSIEFCGSSTLTYEIAEAF